MTVLTCFLGAAGAARGLAEAGLGGVATAGAGAGAFFASAAFLRSAGFSFFGVAAAAAAAGAGAGEEPMKLATKASKAGLSSSMMLFAVVRYLIPAAFSSAKRSACETLISAI